MDILVLAECEIDPVELLGELNQKGDSEFYPPINYSQKFMVFTRFEPDWLRPARDEHRLSVKRLIHPSYADIIVGIVHLRSKVGTNASSQAHLATRFRETIEETESEIGHSRTILFGDFNMNPFDEGMVSSESFHAVMDRATAREGSRTIDFEQRKFFFNPMWGLMGDLYEGPSGTYYFREPDTMVYFWNMLDQVILRPSLLPYFQSDNLTIITQVGDESLLRDNGRPDVNVASDHLPLFFSLALPPEDET